MNTNDEQINTNVEILHKDLSYVLQKCFYNVANKYGKGFKESIYQKALSEEFELNQLSTEPQKRITIYSIDTGKALGVYIPDYVVENLIIVEIKATNFTIQSFIEQQLSYLRASEYELGYLVNFSAPKLFIKRSIYTNDRKPFLNKIRVNS